MFWKQRSAAGSRATWGGAKGEHRARDEEVAWDIQESRPWRPGNQQVGRDPWRPCCHEHELRSPGGDLSSKGHFCRQDFSIDDLAHYTRVHTHAHKASVFLKWEGPWFQKGVAGGTLPPRTRVACLSVIPSSSGEKTL